MRGTIDVIGDVRSSARPPQGIGKHPIQAVASSCFERGGPSRSFRILQSNVTGAVLNAGKLTSTKPHSLSAIMEAATTHLTPISKRSVDPGGALQEYTYISLNPCCSWRARRPSRNYLKPSDPCRCREDLDRPVTPRARAACAVRPQAGIRSYGISRIVPNPGHR